MKRIRVSCGVCKADKFYTINRKPSLIGLLIACESCRHFYNKLKQSPIKEKCSNKFRCFRKTISEDLKCKCCLTIQIVESCVLPTDEYETLRSLLPEESLKLLRGKPLTSADLPTDRGSINLEVFREGKWMHNANLTDAVYKDLCGDNLRVNKPKTNVATKSTGGKKKNSEKPKSEDTIEGRNVESDTSLERKNRRRRKVHTKANNEQRKKERLPVHGPDGKILENGIDLCDCLQRECPGCHFPCPKCRSPKCGNECRENRRWYYERIKIEGSTLVIKNTFVTKF